MEDAVEPHVQTAPDLGVDGAADPAAAISIDSAALSTGSLSRMLGEEVD